MISLEIEVEVEFHKFAGVSWTDYNLKFLGEIIDEDLTKLQTPSNCVNIENENTVQIDSKNPMLKD